MTGQVFIQVPIRGKLPLKLQCRPLGATARIDTCGLVQSPARNAPTVASE
jgi:hypothetical protein